MPSTEKKHLPVVIGAELGMGVAFAVTTSENGASSATSDALGVFTAPEYYHPYLAFPAWSEPRFAWNVGAYVDFYVSEHLAFTTGLSLIDRGLMVDRSDDVM